MYKSTLKSVALTALAFAGLSLSSQAHAATSTVHVEQTGATGTWVLTYPDGTEVQDTVKTKIVTNVGSGTYRVSVRPPANAYAKITLYENSVMKGESTVNSATLEVKDATSYRVSIEYTYGGIVEVNSSPSGVRFAMYDTKGGTFTGTTPATFSAMPTGLYRVTYGLEQDCEAKKSQERSLGAGQKLSFFANIECGSSPIATPGRTAKQLSNNAPAPVQNTTATSQNETQTGPAQRIVQTASASEVVPGGRVRITLSVRNVTRQTLHDLQVTDTFSPDMVSIVTPLADGGAINGNQLEWNVPSIFAGQTWTTSFDVLVKDTVKTGDRILLLARANSTENDLNMYPGAWSSVVGIGVAYMPQTGNMLDMLFALAAMFGATVITNLTVAYRAPVAQKARN